MNRMLMLVLAVLIAACNREDGTRITAPRERDYASPSLPQKETRESPAYDAAAQLAPTQGNAVTGSLSLTGSPQGVRVTGAVQGLKPDGQFGFHIHQKGDCSAPDASSAGEHFNPTGQPHGDPRGEKHHAGDMVSIRSDSAGVAQIDTTVTGVTINSGASDDVIGKAIVVHANADDYKTQPSGNSGDRLACGVIASAG